MKKTINISLGSTSFTVEEDAYASLEGYLHKLKEYFVSQADASEIVADIEARFAEQLLVQPGVGKIVTLTDVERIITAMGEPEQFSDGEPKTKGSPEAGTKRLFRNPDDSIVAGVASGLSAYFGIDPIWLRLGFGLSVLAGGFGVAVYVVLWIIIPEAKTESEKMQMRGEPVNLANIVKERVEEIKKKDHSKIKQDAVGFFEKLGVLIETLARALSKVVGSFGKVILTIIGIALSIAASLAIIGLVVSVVSLLFNAHSSLVDFPFRELAHGWMYYTTIVSAFFVVLIPLLFLLLLGTSMLAKRSTLARSLGFSMLGFWVVALIVVLNGAFYFAPQVREISETSPYFKTVTRELGLKDFKNLEITGATQVNVHISESYRVVVTGTERDLEEHNIMVDNGTLTNSSSRHFRICVFCRIRPVTLDVYMPTMERVSVSGASQITGDVWGRDIFLDLSGASRGELHASVDHLTFNLSGASRLQLSGNISDITAKLSGASRLLAGTTMVSSNVIIDLSGASRAEFGNLVSLTLDASGASTLRYRNAERVQQRLSGASKLIHEQGEVQEDSGIEPREPVEPIEPIDPQL